MHAMHSDLHLHLARALAAERVPPRHPVPRVVRGPRRGVLRRIRPA
jgi:hypothetical protein